MSSKKWDDAELDRVSAELDAELEEIFAEVDRVKRRPDPEAGLPKAEILPDDFDEEPRKTAPFRFDGPGDPPEIEILPDDFEPDDPEEEAVGDFGRISPAEVFDADFTVEAESRRPGDSAAPSRRASGDRSTPAPARPAPGGDSEEPGEADDPGFFPSAHYDDFQAGSIGDLSPDEFGRLVERAVERAILSAIAKAGL